MELLRGLLSRGLRPFRQLDHPAADTGTRVAAGLAGEVISACVQNHGLADNIGGTAKCQDRVSDGSACDAAGRRGHPDIAEVSGVPSAGSPSG